MKKLLSILLAAALMFALPAAALASYETEPGGIAASGMALVDGTLYIADSYNKVIWKSEGGEISLLAGRCDVKDSSGEPVGGYRDGSFGEAAFMEPWGIAPWKGGLLVSDSGNGCLRWLDLEEGKVYTAIDGLSLPTGLAAGEDGCVYIAETGRDRILRLDADGSYETFLSAGLSEPTGLAWADGALYVADTGSHRLLTVKGGVTGVLAGAALDGDAAYEGGYLDGSAAQAMFSGPQGLALAPDGGIYIADTGNSAVRLLKDGTVTTVAMAGGTPTWPVSPRSLLIDGGMVYVGDVFARLIFACGPAGTVPDFTDVPAGAWYCDAVAYVCTNGLFKGTSATEFSPDASMTRAMLITVLARRAGVDTSTGSTWYEAAIAWAQEAGVSDGTMPESPVTREQLVTMLWREAGEPAASGSLEGFADAAALSSWAEPAMLWAVERGVIEGSDGQLAPAASATRAQAAAILMRCAALD